MWCVYKHTSPYGKSYIGITSRRPEDRWRHGEGYKHNKHFYNAIQMYGWDNFKHEIIATDLSESEAKSMEIDLIRKLRTQDQAIGYNISSGGDGICGVHRFGADNSFYGKRHTEEAKRKMSLKHKGRSGEQCTFYGKHHTEETKRIIASIHAFPVIQYDTDLNYIDEYESAIQASRETGIFQSQILGCCNRKTGYKTAGGYVWIFKKDQDQLNYAEQKERINHEKLPKPICQLTLGMEFIDEFESIASAAYSTSIPAPDISNAANGQTKTSGGYIWIFKTEYQKMLRGDLPMRKPYRPSFYKPVIQYSENMEPIREFDSMTDAAIAMNVTRPAIRYAITKSKTGKLGGYVWKYKEVS